MSIFSHICLMITCTQKHFAQLMYFTDYLLPTTKIFFLFYFFNIWRCFLIRQTKFEFVQNWENMNFSSALLSLLKIFCIWEILRNKSFEDLFLILEYMCSACVKCLLLAGKFKGSHYPAQPSILAYPSFKRSDTKPLRCLGSWQHLQSSPSWEVSLSWCSHSTASILSSLVLLSSLLPNKKGQPVGRTEWSIFCHEIRTKECPFKHSDNTWKIKLKK